MKFYFLNKNIMKVNLQLQTPETNLEKKVFKKKLKTLITSVALLTSLILTTPTNAQTMPQSITIVLDWGIDNSSILRQIETKIDHTDTKQKNDYIALFELETKRDTIKTKNIQELNKKIARLDKNNLERKKKNTKLIAKNREDKKKNTKLIAINTKRKQENTRLVLKIVKRKQENTRLVVKIVKRKKENARLIAKNIKRKKENAKYINNNSEKENVIETKLDKTIIK